MRSNDIIPTHKEAIMRCISITLACLCTLMMTLPVSAKEKKSEKALDPQAMMEVWKKAAMPGGPISCLPVSPVVGRLRLKSGWNLGSRRQNPPAPLT